MPIKFGRFYYQQTSNGNLIGEYANSGMQHIGTESAVLVSSQSAIPFVGDFDATWLEGSTAIVAKLNIGYDPTSKFYTLTWHDPASGNNFNGEGMLCGDILIGSYE